MKDVIRGGLSDEGGCVGTRGAGVKGVGVEVQATRGVIVGEGIKGAVSAGLTTVGNEVLDLTTTVDG